MNYVINKNGATIDFDAALMLMDLDIMRWLECTELEKIENDQDYFTAYEAAHLKKYGEEWELSKANPVY